MPDRCRSNFDDTLISGYLDDELTQSSQQKVRVHLEDCAHCCALYTQLKTIREATMTTRFVQPPDSQWDERPRGPVGTTTRGLGWILVVAWLLTVTGFGLWQLWTEPATVVERLVVFGGLSAFAVLFLSVLLDRIRTAKSDRYREVQK